MCFWTDSKKASSPFFFRKKDASLSATYIGRSLAAPVTITAFDVRPKILIQKMTCYPGVTTLMRMALCAPPPSRYH
jgi:hypothetical protein